MLIKGFWKTNILKEQTTNKRCFFWNMMGCGMNAAASMLLLLIVTRVLGAFEGGIFSIGYAVACQVWTFANFETTTYHVTSKDEEYSNNHFFQQKSILCMMAIVASVIIVILKNYDMHKTAVVLGLCIFKILDAFSSFYTGVFQKEGRLDVGGYSYFWRNLSCLISFGVTIVTSHNLMLAIIVMCIISLGWIFIIDARIGAYVINYKAKWELSKVWRLFMECLGVFLASFLLVYVINMPKYTIDRLMDEASQTYFNIIFLPVSIINLLGLFIFRPTLTTMSDLWNEREYNSLEKMCEKIIVSIMLMTIVIVVVGYLIGIPVLEIVFGVELADYKLALILTLVGGGLYAIVTFLYYIMVVMRKHNLIIVAYAIALLGQVVCGNFFVENKGITGASVEYLLAMLFVVVMAMIAAKAIVSRARKES